MVNSINTRQEMAELMLRLLEPIKPYFSEQKARLKLGETSAHYADATAGMEGFARPLWGLAAYWGGNAGTDCRGDNSGKDAGVGRGANEYRTDEEWAQIYRGGIIAGTNPQSPEYWGDCAPYDQMLVEMAALAFTLLWAEEKILTPMNDEEKHNLFAWLSQINRNPCYDCNWRFFHVLVNVALKKVGQPYDAAGMEASLQFLETCYAGDGWYYDGPDGQADYYIPFAMHFYALVYAVFMKEEDPQRCARFIDRAMMFGKDFAYWFAEDGSALPYGRSLTYRFAQAAFYSACVMAHMEPLPLGVMKGILLRHLDYWLRQPIFDHTGVLTVGYRYPNLTMAESYNAPGSPYWAMKIFACLTLPADDPFWRVEPQPLPAMEEIKCFPAAKMFMQRTPDGHAVCFPAGLQVGHVHTRMDEKYSKFAYSTKYGFSVMHSQYGFSEAAPDSVLSFEIDRHIFIRRTIDSYEIKDGRMFSQWSPFSGICVRTEIIPGSRSHRRIHEIESEYDCIAYDSGFALPLDDDSCHVSSLSGEGEELVWRVNPNTNLLHSKTKIPLVRYRIKKGRTRIETEVTY